MTITLTPEQFKAHLEEERRLAVRANPPQIMSVQEAAWFLDMHPQTVYTRVAEGKLPAHKDGRILKFHLEEIRSWAQAWRRA